MFMTTTLNCKNDPKGFHPRNVPFHIPAISSYACHYDISQLDFTHEALCDIDLPKELSQATHQRKAEFLIGRVCAVRALKFIHYCAMIGRNDDRSPRWPATITGSITHCKGFGMAAVGSAETFYGIGIDSELICSQTQIETFAEQFIKPCEFNLGLKNDFAIRNWLYAVFSAKESVFKCLYPIIKSFFGFFEVQIISVQRLSENEGIIDIKIGEFLKHKIKRSLLQCHFKFEEEYVHTLVALHRENPF